VQECQQCGGGVEGAVSISEPEAARLARYLREEEDTLELARASASAEPS
jgi:hypothetical protein